MGSGNGLFSNWVASLDACPVFSFDIEQPKYMQPNERLKFEQADILRDTAFHDRIREEIQSAGRVMLLCDNGNKVEESKIFSEFLKPGDLIMIHDYAPSERWWEKHHRPWRTLEVVESDCTWLSNGFTPFFEKPLLLVGWGCWLKVEASFLAKPKKRKVKNVRSERSETTGSDSITAVTD